MGRKGEKVGPELFDIDASVRNQLCPVYHDPGSDVVSQLLDTPRRQADRIEALGR